MALKGMEPAPNPQRRGGSTNLKGALLSLLRQRHNIKGNDSTVQGKTKPTQNKDKSFNPQKRCRDSMVKPQHGMATSYTKPCYRLVCFLFANAVGTSLRIYDVNKLNNFLKKCKKLYNCTKMIPVSLNCLNLLTSRSSPLSNPIVYIHTLPPYSGKIIPTI